VANCTTREACKKKRDADYQSQRAHTKAQLKQGLALLARMDADDSKEAKRAKTPPKRTSKKAAKKGKAEAAAPPAPAQDPSTMKVTDLRTALEERGLDTSGLKKVLQARLSDALDKEIEGGEGGGEGGGESIPSSSLSSAGAEEREGIEGKEGKEEDSGSGGGAAPRKQLPVAVDPATRKVLVEAAMSGEVVPYRKEPNAMDGWAPAYDTEAVERMLAEDPAQCTLRDGDAAPPVVTAAAYGVEALVASMITHAGAAAINAVDADGRDALNWAVSFNCSDSRTCYQPCAHCMGDDCLGDEWDDVCILDARRPGKLAVVKLLGPRSSAAAVKQALGTAKELLDSLQDDLLDRRQDARDNYEEEHSDECGLGEWDDSDVGRACDNLAFAKSLVVVLVETLQGFAKA
jgi:hypothetical protein